MDFEADLLNEVAEAIMAGSSGHIVCAKTYLPHALREKILKWRNENVFQQGRESMKKNVIEVVAGTDPDQSSLYRLNREDAIEEIKKL